MAQETIRTIGWVGIGRMGYPMAERLIKAGHNVRVWNRTRAKAEPLARIGAASLNADPEAYLQADFAALLETVALNAGLTPKSENKQVKMGLET